MSGSTVKPQRPGMERFRMILPAAALAALLLLYLGSLGGVPLFDGDEPRYGQAVREMRRNQDWLTPTYNGEHRFQKPVLIYWCMLLATALLGFNEAALRLPAALSLIGLCLLIYRFAADRLGARPAFIAAGFLAFSPQSVILGRAATPDALLTLAISAAMLSFYAAYSAEEEHSRLPAYLFWLFLSIAVLAKGPVGAALPLAGCAALTLWNGDLRRAMRRAHWGPGLLIFSVVALPWFLLMYVLHGTGFTGFFFGQEHLGRFTRPMEGHSGPFFYYAAALLIFAFPWVLLLPAALLGRRDLFGLRGAADEEGRIIRFAVAWALPVLILFSISRTKLPHYIYPAYPALALLAAAGWMRLGRCSATLQQRAARAGFAAAALLGALAAALPAAAGRIDLSSRLAWGAALLLVLTALGLTGAGFSLTAGNLRCAQIRLTSGVAAACLYLALFLAPAIHARVSGAPVALGRAAAARSDIDAVGTWRTDHSAFIFYADRVKIDELKGKDELQAWRGVREGGLLLSGKGSLYDLPAAHEPVAVHDRLALVRLAPQPAARAAPAGRSPRSLSRSASPSPRGRRESAARPAAPSSDREPPG